MAIAAGADGLVHLFADRPPPADFVRRAREAGVFVVATLGVTGTTTGVPAGRELAADARVAPFLDAAEHELLRRAYPRQPGSRIDLTNAATGIRALAEAGIPILAGSDAPNPGTAHGVTMHGELELLVKAGLSPTAALTAATAAPADAFRLADRGRIRPGLRADLLLVEGDPTTDITATRNLVAIWKRGVRFQRPRHDVVLAEPPKRGGGRVSDFETALGSSFETDWKTSTDAVIGGKSTASLTRLAEGADGSQGAMRITGAVAADSPNGWAGAVLHPGGRQGTAVDLSATPVLAFAARGSGTYDLSIFARRFGLAPVSRSFTADAEWRRYVVPFAELSGFDGRDVTAIFIGSITAGAFTLDIDDVELRTSQE
jgi:hypothetical protein